MGGLIISLEGVHLTLTSTMLIPLQQYFNVSTLSYQFACAFIFFGIGVGSYLLGITVEKFGRIAVIRSGLIALAITHLLITLSTNIVVFTIFRFILGVCFGIILPVILNIVCEYLPVYFRSYVLTALWAFFQIGQSIASFFMLMFMPSLAYTESQAVLLGVFIVCLLIEVVLFIFIKDSPRNLILHNQISEGIEIINNMIAEKLSSKDESEIVSFIQSGSNQQFKDHFVLSLFESDVKRTTINLIVVWVFNSVITNGALLIYTPTLKKVAFESNQNVIASMLMMCGLGLAFTSTMPLLTEIKWLGLKRFNTILYVLSFITCILIVAAPKLIYYWLIPNSLINSVIFNVMTTYTCCLYPTKIRDTALGFFYSCTRVGGFLSQFLYLGLFEVDYILPYYFTLVFTGLCLVSSVLLKQEPSDEMLDREYIHN